MPDSRSHRGAHPEDARDFALAQEPVLRTAVAELSYLLTREYAETAALKLVGDHHQLTSRQRRAVARAACSDQALERRRQLRVQLEQLAGQELGIDGFNCLITVETMLARAPVFRGRDGALRDLASVHGTYRRVEETDRAIALIVRHLIAARLGKLAVYLDRPVGNSGRVRALFELHCSAHGLAAEVTLSDRVDRELAVRELPIASSDSWLLERVRWLDLPAAIAASEQLPLWTLTL